MSLDEVAERPEQRLQADGDHLGREGSLVLPAVTGGLVVLAVVRLHQREVAEAFLGDGADGARPSPQLPGRRLDAPGQEARDGQEPGCGDEGREREPPVEKEQHPGIEDDLEGIRQRHVHAGHDQRLDGRDIATQARHHVAQLAPLEKAQRQALHVREQVDAQIQNESFADPRGQILIDPGDNALHDGDSEVQRGHRNEESKVVRGEHVVDEYFVEVETRRGESGDGAGEQQAHRHPAAKAAGVGPEPAEHRAQRDLRSLFDEAVVLVVRFGDR